MIPEASGSVQTSQQRERLMVLIPDALSAIVSKGEVTERYYNPGDLFREVHIVMTNDDRPPADAVQPMVGTARLYLHNLPTDDSLFRRTLGWRPRLLRSWAAKIVGLADEVHPQLMRCHGVHLNAYVASEIHRATGIPYVISLHGNPDVDLRHHWRGHDGDWRARLAVQATVAIERTAIRNAECVVCVYRFIEPYARRMGAKRVEAIYNVVNLAHIREKTEYAATDPAKVIVPGRQWPRKDPRPVIDALELLPNVRCTFVGTGPLHAAVVEHARKLGVADRCVFVVAMPNDRLCETLRSYDVLVSVNDYGGVSKVELEAALAGMPIITNRHPLESKPEVLEDGCLTVDGDAASYRDALQHLLGDETLRAQLGRQAKANARAVHPERAEETYAALYLDVLTGTRPVVAAD